MPSKPNYCTLRLLRHHGVRQTNPNQMAQMLDMQHFKGQGCCDNGLPTF
jgi:hypothetical protein